jgi:pimeloyl-ACP methyl ester carboxylesterase
MIALLFGLAGCFPKYAAKGPIGPDDLATPGVVRHVAVDGVDVAYVDTGGEQSPIVVVHGLSSYMGFWEYQVPFLARNHRVIVLDLPGFGASARPDDAWRTTGRNSAAIYSPPWYAGVVAEFMDAVGAPRATVMGHSMGGQIAMTLALDHPSKVSALVLSAPAGFERFTPGEAAWMASFWTDERALGASEDEVRANFMTAAFNRHDAGVERLIEERVRLGLDPSFRGTSRAVGRSIAGMVLHPVLDRLAAIDCPTLIVYGTEDRMIPNPILHGGRTRSIAEAGQRAIRGAELVMIPGGGHTLHHDAPDEFNAAVQAFLGKLDDRRRRSR